MALTYEAVRAYAVDHQLRVADLELVLGMADDEYFKVQGERMQAMRAQLQKKAER